MINKWFLFIFIFMMTTCTNAAFHASYIKSDFFPDANASKAVWANVIDEGFIVKDWKGEREYPFLKTSFKCLWSDSFLYFLFVAPFDKITVDQNVVPDKSGDCWNIWDHDVVELFISDNSKIKTYFEFVISPLGQHIDISHTKNWLGQRKSFAGYTSGWQSAVRLDEQKKLWITEFRIPLKAINTSKSRSENVFKFNAYRCNGCDPDRAYLALYATYTPMPNFHVPERFEVLMLLK
jgi:hypothetical protein